MLRRPRWSKESPTGSPSTGDTDPLPGGAFCHHRLMPIDVLQLSDGLPERSLEPGEVLYAQGEPSSDVVILIEGRLQITAGDVVIDSLAAPGTFVGEIGALLGQPRDATVTATAPTRVRVVGDPAGFVADYPELGLEIARQLAGRVHRLTAYIGDVQRQFADRDDHLGMFAEVLGRLSSRPSVDIEPGSDRSPDY